MGKPLFFFQFSHREADGGTVSAETLGERKTHTHTESSRRSLCIAVRLHKRSARKKLNALLVFHGVLLVFLRFLLFDQIHYVSFFFFDLFFFYRLSLLRHLGIENTQTHKKCLHGCLERLKQLLRNTVRQK